MSDERDDALDALARAHGADPDELRQEISRFRLALDADLTIAAAAAEEEEPGVAADVLSADSAALPGFERRLRTRIADVVRRRHRASRRRVVAVAAAAGMAGVVGGAAVAATVVGHSEPAPPMASSSPADLSPAQTLAFSQAGILTYAAEHRLPTPTILAASGALQATLLPLMAQAPHDKALASQLRSLLTSQRAALSSVPSPDAQVDAAIRSTQSQLTQLAAGVQTAATAVSPAPAATPARRTPAAGVAPTIIPSVPASPHPHLTPPTSPPLPHVRDSGLPGPG